MTLILGVTGIIGTGKSSVAKYLAEKHKFNLIDVDKIGHDLLVNNQELKKELVNNFSTDQRAKLAEIVFNDKNKLLDLNDLMHPKMVVVVKKLVDEYHGQHQNVVIDAALLYVMGLDQLCDKVICLIASEDVIYQRLQKKGLTDEQIAVRLACAPFIPEEDTVVIENNRKLENIFEQIEAIISK